MPARLVGDKRVAVLVSFFVLAALGRQVCAQQEDSGTYTDRIHLKNGDVITGDIKTMETGRLRFKTLTMDTVFINWLDIDSIESDKYLRIERVDGNFTYGVIQRSNVSQGLVVADGVQQVEVPMLSVSTIQPILVSESFWRQLEGDISAGIDYKKASDLLVINLASNVRFKRPKYELEFGANWNETSRTENNDSSRADLNGTYTRFLRNRWFWKASTAFERNDELGIDLRTQIGGTAGKYLIQKPTWRWAVNAGLAQNRELRQDGGLNSTEGLIRLSFDLFNYTVPIKRLSANISVYPGITESDRLRVNTDITFRNEIVRSLFWDLSFYSTFDNRPPEGAAQRDYGIVTSIGATF